MMITTERIGDQILFTIDSDDRQILWWLGISEAAELGTTLIMQASTSCDSLDQVPEDFRPPEEPPTP